MGKAIIIPGVSFASMGLGRVTTAIPLISISITPVVGTIINSHQMELSFYPSGAAPQSVRWSIASGSAYASIDQSTGLLTVLNGANADSVTVRAEVVGNPSIYDETTVTVTRQVTDVWYVDNLAYKSLATNTDTRYFPAMCAQVPALDGVPVNRFKFACEESGASPAVTLAIYNFDNVNDPAEVEVVGTFSVSTGGDGVATVSFPVKTLSAGQIVGIKNMLNCGIKFSTSAVGSNVDGGWAQTAFSGTLFIGIGYYD